MIHPQLIKLPIHHLLRNLLPVSYTHLDVYKRQHQQDRDEKNHHQLVQHLAVGEETAGEGRIPVTRGTVSYTHLDVYKRQAGNSTPAINKRW